MRNPRIRLVQFRDQRTIQQLALGNAIAQEQADQRLEAEWRRRVRMNVRLRASAKG